MSFELRKKRIEIYENYKYIVCHVTRTRYSYFDFFYKPLCKCLVFLNKKDILIIHRELSAMIFYSYSKWAQLSQYLIQLHRFSLVKKNFFFFYTTRFISIQESVILMLDKQMQQYFHIRKIENNK
jgi:hypothetical protein